MKTLVIAFAVTGLALAAFPQTSQAQSKKYYKYSKNQSYSSYGRSRRYSRRDYNRLPIDVTGAPNTGAYQYRDFPLWAARAFAPNDGTR